jgi:UDP-N-acetylmuramoyl-L-alanyl-D-glutamate--2,6-diaminopimelate ligase
MHLSELVSGFHIAPPGADPEISAVTEDSRRVRPGSLFIAVPGRLLDGHAYIADAVGRGAAAVVAERTGAIPSGVPVVRVPSSRDALAEIASRFYGTARSDLSLVGFTGTFGKTSTSEILRALLDASGSETGVVGSLGARYKTFYDPGHGLTTPAPVELHRMLRGLESAGATTVIMEVTSHALVLGRVDGVYFDGGLVAAIMPGEHTDFHRSYEDYVDAKRLFLTHLKPEATLAYDADNLAARQIVGERGPRPTEPASGHSHGHRSGHRLPQRVRDGEAVTGETAGFSLHGRETDLRLYDIALDDKGATFSMGGRLAGARAGIRIYSPLLGGGHLRNVALALTYALAEGLPISAAEAVIAKIEPLRRRMERYTVDNRTILDDTAAHPDSFRSTFDVASLLPHTRLTTVYAIRGGRGVEINRQNALALADLCFLHGVEPLIVTPCAETAGPADTAMPGEIDATRQALVSRGRRFVWHDALSGALREAFERTAAGDLIVLLGAQGMNDAKRLLGLES